jgi:hypothetical protein
MALPSRRHFQSTSCAAAAIAALGATATAQNQAPAAPPPDTRPAFAVLRQTEDWSKFDGQGGGVLDRLKHIALSDDGSVWVSFGGRADARLESWSDFRFAPVNDDAFVLSRVFAHGDLHVGKTFRLFVEGKSAQATDRDLPGGRRAIDLDTLDLQQLFVDVDIPVGDGLLRVRPGRQMLQFGAQRLVSPLVWANAMRTFEGLTVEWRAGAWTVTGIATQFVPVDKTDFNEADDDTRLFGVHAKNSAPGAKNGYELYALGNSRANVNANGTLGDADRLTFGTRWWAPFAERFDYEVEAAYQTGEVGAGDVSAWSFASQLGWRPANLAGAPRFFAGLDAASGDDETGGDVGTFDQLFPLGHAYFGFIDEIGRQNVLAASLGGRWTLQSTTTLSAAAHAFRVLETADAIYDAGGAATRTGFDSRDVGSELDLLVEHKFARHLDGQLGYSHFFPGDAIDESGADAGIDFVYAGLKFTF